MTSETGSDATSLSAAEAEAAILDDRDPSEVNRHRRAIFSVPVEIVVSVGRARPRVSDLLGLRRDSLLALDARLDDPVELLVGKRVIARGQLEEIEGEPGRLGVRLTEIVDLSDPF